MREREREREREKKKKKIAPIYLPTVMVNFLITRF